MRIENCQTNPGSGHLINPERYPIPGSFQAPIALFLTRFSGSNGSGVHADRKYRFKWLFLENNDFNRDFAVQFSGLLAASFFSVIISRVFGRNGLQMPLVARCCNHFGELGILAGF